MDLLTSPGEMQRWTQRQRALGCRVGFVPTMGALHDGHLSLVDEARRHADVVVMSIFVNPLQFDVRADFDRYPRPIDDDLARCRAAGLDAVYAPTPAAMYPPGFQTYVEPGPLAERLEGTHRPGHFRGVTTVVAKLFGAVQPHVAVFGRKDAQQLAVIRRMTIDLDFGIEIVGMETVREPDGLALSSRNRHLSPEDRAAAGCISAGMRTAAHRFADGIRDSAELVTIARVLIESEPRVRIEYLEVVDPETFTPIDGTLADDSTGLLTAAVWFGEVRLIDNMPIRFGHST